MTLEPAALVGGGSAHLLVIHDASSSRYSLPREGVVVVGRAPDADIRVDSTAVSRRHAKFIVADDGISVCDLGSHNGTRVNGERIEGTRALASGDVVTIGEAAFFLRRESRTRCRSQLDPTRTRQRLDEEIERAVECGRPLAVVVLASGAGVREGAAVDHVRAVLRPMDIVGSSASHIVVILPELGGEAARAVATDILEAQAESVGVIRAGVASYPVDGGDAGTLLSAAQAAVERARPGGVATADETVLLHVIDGQTIVVADAAMVRLFDMIRRLAASELSVLVLGETGTGKENIAAAVHHWSPRAPRPMVKVNCGALPDTLVESELFGYEKGAFSEARAAKPGLLERAHGGTVFLDEVGELSSSAQAKLLRAIEAKRFMRLGDLREREVDIRVVAATNRDLPAEVRAGRFREDLLFRMSAAMVHVPPLRHRPREIPILARHFLADACARAARPPLELYEATMTMLVAHAWPGNVRELKNAIEFAATTADGEVIEPWNFPEQISHVSTTHHDPHESAPKAAEQRAPRRFRTISEELRELERTRMREALDATGGVQTRAADLIGMPIRTFVLKVKQYNLSGREGKRRLG